MVFDVLLNEKFSGNHCVQSTYEFDWIETSDSATNLCNRTQKRVHKRRIQLDVKHKSPLDHVRVYPLIPPLHSYPHENILIFSTLPVRLSISLNTGHPCYCKKNFVLKIFNIKNIVSIEQSKH